MGKYLILLFALTLLASPALAHEDTASTEVVVEESITAEDLEVAEPTLLPTSPFYFLKNFTRTVQRVLTFNAVSRAELELRIADEKLAETKVIAERDPKGTQALDRAIENYRDSQERLKTRLEGLRETSENPNVDRLLDKLADRTVKHERIFEELKAKFENREGLRVKIESVKNAVEDSAVAGSNKDTPERFVQKLERALVEVRGAEFKHLQSIEILDRVHARAGDELKDQLLRVRRDFTKRLEEDLDKFAEEKENAAELIRKNLEGLPGDKVRRLVILEELREKSDASIRNALDRAHDALKDELEKRSDIRERALDAMEHAKERIDKLERKSQGATAVPPAVRQLLQSAKTYLDSAVRAFENDRFGEAFGQARSAEVQARNGLRILEAERPEKDDLDEDLEDLKEDLQEWRRKINSLEMGRKVKAESLLGQAHDSLNRAEAALEQGNLRVAKALLEEVKNFLRMLERLFEETRKADVREQKESVPPVRKDTVENLRERATELKDEAVACIQLYDPVCGADGKTYSNSCFAKVAGVEIKHRGECETRTSTDVKTDPNSTATDRTETTPMIPSDVTVVVDERGNFTPYMIKVKKGGTVTWVNKSSRSVWPASAIHPTHTIYPGFDALRGIQPGERYSFKFDRAGEWRYHDHLNASVTGAVEVVE